MSMRKDLKFLRQILEGKEQQQQKKSDLQNQPHRQRKKIV